MGAEKPAIAAERAGRKIAVEIQSFLARSAVRDLQEALGQYGAYQAVLMEAEPDRALYMAVPLRVHEGILSERFGQLMVRHFQVRVLVFDEAEGKVLQWIEPTGIETPSDK